MSLKLALLVITAFFFLSYVASAQNSCIDCHEKLTPFTEKEKSFNEVRVKHLARNVPCSLECHADTLDKIASSNYEQWSKSKHALFRITCDKCHGGNTSADLKEAAHIGVKRESDTESTVFYRNVPETCGKCHVDEFNQFKDSKHYQQLKALKQAPTCDTCHRPHMFRILNTTDFENICSNCHNEEMKIKSMDAPEQAKKYLDDAKQLDKEIIKTRKAIMKAKSEGKDVTTATAELTKAENVLDETPKLWHRFDLSQQASEIQIGFDAVNRAQAEIGIKPETIPGITSAPKTPGFEAIAAIALFAGLYGIFRRK